MQHELEKSLVKNGFSIVHNIREDYYESDGSVTIDLIMIAREKVKDLYRTLSLPMTGYFELMVFYPGYIINDNQVNLDPSGVTVEESLIQVFPNLTKDIVNVEINEVGFFKLLIYNTKGLLVSSQMYKGNSSFYYRRFCLHSWPVFDCSIKSKGKKIFSETTNTL